MSSTEGDANKLTLITSAQPCCHFSLAEIRSATNDFDDEWVIGRGGFGKVYKGQIWFQEIDHVVAIKRLESISNQGESEFKVEIQILSKLRHRHLVSLVGFCDENNEKILVYEYMPHGTLYDHLHKAKTPLSWIQRLKMAIGAARGLKYLHTDVGTQHGIIHRDVKSSNILLDKNWEALISDFGLSKVGPSNQSLSCIDASVKGTFGYLDPEYFYTNKLTRKTDVYAFGVVLFELLSGRLAVDERNADDQCSLVLWAKRCLKNRKLDQMVDSNIRGTISPKCVRRFAKIAESCVHSLPKERPSMTGVVASLQDLLELHEKSDISSMGFALKIHKYLVSANKQNSNQSGSSSHKAHEKNMKECPASPTDGRRKSVARDVNVFKYVELKLATRNFSYDRRLGFGFNGRIYRGRFDNTGLDVAVRKLDRYELFLLDMYKEFRHPNLVQLKGYCIKDEDLFLVYEFMCNGNFKNLLESGAVARLPLVTKIKIVVGIARGMVFLEEVQPRVRKTRKTHGGSQLGRKKILLDEITPSGSYAVPRNLSGFVELFIEVLTGERFHRFMSKSEKEALQSTAKLCFEICNDVDAESKMLTAIDKYEKHFQEWGINNTNSEGFYRGMNYHNLRKEGLEKEKGYNLCMVFLHPLVVLSLIYLCIICFKTLWLLIWAVMLALPLAVILFLTL